MKKKLKKKLLNFRERGKFPYTSEQTQAELDSLGKVDQQSTISVFEGLQTPRAFRGEWKMLPSQAKRLLGFPTNSTPSPSEVKEAYKKMAWDCHPDRFPESEKVISEARFKLVLEAYTCLKTGPNTGAASYSYVHYGRGCTCKGFGHTNSILVMMPFALIVLGTLSFGGFRAVKLYKEQRQTYPSSNPFLP